MPGLGEFVALHHPGPGLRGHVCGDRYRTCRPVPDHRSCQFGVRGDRMHGGPRRLGAARRQPQQTDSARRRLADPGLPGACGGVCRADIVVRHVDRSEAGPSRSAGQVAGYGRRGVVLARDHEGALGHVEAACARPAQQALHDRRRRGHHDPDRGPAASPCWSWSSSASS